MSIVHLTRYPAMLPDLDAGQQVIDLRNPGLLLLAETYSTEPGVQWQLFYLYQRHRASGEWISRAWKEVPCEQGR